MGGHSHNPTADTQNQGNSLGDRSCVRQSKLYRMYESGNDVKSILGTAHLCWDSNQKQGAYQGHQVYDHTVNDPLGVNDKFNNTFSRHDVPDHYSTNTTTTNKKRSDDKGGVGNFLTGYTDGTGTDYRRGPISGKQDAAKRPPVGGRGGRDYDDEPAPYQDHRRAARNSFSNDENNARERNYDRSNYEERSYPTKQRDSYDQPRGNSGSDDRYRNMKGDMESSLSSYQSKKNQYADPPVPQERSAVRIFKQDKPTRPW